MTSVLELDSIGMTFSLDRWFLRDPTPIRAVEDVTLSVGEAETLGLVGESGCGKSTIGRIALRLMEPTTGSVKWAGDVVSGLPEREVRPRRALIQAVFQDPYSAMNARMTVADIVVEPLIHLGLGDASSRKRRVDSLLRDVGLRPEDGGRRPHAFSGGQRQRIAIARALGPTPKLIVCDEAVSALDVSVRAQVVNLLKRLQVEQGLSYLFISHELAIVRHISHRVAVMYLGRIVEVASAADLYSSPAHPYTRALIDAVPHPDPTRKRMETRLQGEVPSARNLPSGCAFHTRCPRADRLCREERPKLVEIAPGRTAACHFPS